METNFNLQLLTWNANDITHHKLELQGILNENNIDLAMISESQLTLPDNPQRRLKRKWRKDLLS